MNYRDFQPGATTRVRESIEWSTTYSYNATDTINPRVLLIGDSICNGYQSAVRQKLGQRANITFWASSKCITDPDYFRELDFMIDSYPYALVSFNNGLHSLKTSREEWVEAYRAAVRFIRAKLPDAALVLTLCTALNDPEKNEIVKRINADAAAIAEEYRLPVIDLFTPMDSLDKASAMADVFHYKAPAIDIQAGIIADFVTGALGLTDGDICQHPTETGPSGALK